MRVDGPSMVDAGIFDKDIVVVDRSLEPRHDDVVVVVVDGERSLKRLDLSGAVPRLCFANAAPRLSLRPS
jgi:DNA polymerase V